MTSPARAIQSNNDAIRRVQHLSEAAVLLWPTAPDLAQYYLFRMQQAAEKDNLKIPHRTASKICPSCGGLVTGKLRLVPAKRRSRRSAQLAARESKSASMHGAEVSPPAHPRNVLQQHCARCQHCRLFLAFQRAPALAAPVTVTPVKRVPVADSVSASVAPQPSTAKSASLSLGTKLGASAGHGAGPVHQGKHSAPSPQPGKHSAPPPQPGKAHKQSMKSQVSKLLHATKSQDKKKNVQAGLKRFLDSIDM